MHIYIHIPIGFPFLLQAMCRWWALAILFWHVSGEAAAGRDQTCWAYRPRLFSPEPGSSSCRAFRAGFAACKLQWQSHSQKIMNHQLRNLDPLGRFLKQTPPKKTPAQSIAFCFT